MASYVFAPNGGSYGQPHGLIKTLLKVRSTAKRDGADFKFKPPSDHFSRGFHTVIRFLLTARHGLKKLKIGELAKFATDCKGDTDLGHVYLVRRVEKLPDPVPINDPVYVGMPTTARQFSTPYGTIYAGGLCKDDYNNIQTKTAFDQRVTLQSPAMVSFLAAAKQVGGIKLTGSFRPCALQSSLYARDPNRYANPNTSGHCRALAIDVSTAQTPAKLEDIHRELGKRGWFQSRPVDEPWHYSYALRT